MSDASSGSALVDDTHEGRVAAGSGSRLGGDHLEFPCLAAGVQRVTLGDQSVVTRDGRVHLALDGTEAALLDLMDGSRSRAEILDRLPSADSREREREREQILSLI